MSGLSTPATGEFGSLSGGLVLVTAEADKTGAGGTAQIVRFIVESPVAPVPVSTSVKPHAL